MRVFSIVLFAGLLAVPLLAQATGEPYQVIFMARVVIFALAASALNLSLGLGGMVSFGHALFLGLGSYCVALPAFHGLDNAWVQILLCLGVSGGIACLTGMISLRTAGIGFIMITLAFAQMGYYLFVSLKQYGGDDGLTIANTSRLPGLDLGEANTVYLLSCLLLILFTWWMARLRVSPFGMTLRAAHKGAPKVNALGLPARRYQLAAYVMSAMVCSVSGLLLANLNAYASPSTMAWSVSGELIVMVVLGGMGTVMGPILGAVAFLVLEEGLKGLTDHWMAVFGLAVLLIALLGKGGIHALITRLAALARDRAPRAASLSQPAEEDAR